MIEIKDIDRLIRELCAEKLQQGERVKQAWLAQELVQRHTKPSDSDFSLCAAYWTSKERVAAHFREEKNRETDDSQTKLPGFEKLQTRYLIRGELVPTEQLTVAEVRTKAKELRAMARGLLAHADELDRYADAKQDAAE